MHSREQFYSEHHSSFDYEAAALLAQQRLEAERSDNKQDKSAVKRRVKELYGSGDSDSPERKLFDLEYDKQKLLVTGKEEFSKLSPETRLSSREETRPLSYIGGDRFSFDSRGEYIVFVTLADLIADLQWGLYYELPVSTPVEIKKKYVSAYYAHAIHSITDHQLVIQRLDVDNVNQKDLLLGKAYEEARKRIERNEESEQAGILFEKMISGLLFKVAQDIPELNIRLDRVTVVEDVELKIDFIIHADNKKRGVGVDEVQEDKTLGIQFTLHNKDEEYRIKERQIAQRQKKLKEVDELLLISVPASCKEVMSVYGKWKNQGRPAGGPENFLGPEKATKYVFSVLQQTRLADDPAVREQLSSYFKSKKSN